MSPPRSSKLRKSPATIPRRKKSRSPKSKNAVDASIAAELLRWNEMVLQDKAFLKKVRRVKTQQCSSFVEFGRCNYGKKCRFAHGFSEQRKKSISPRERKPRVNPLYKTKPCLKFRMLGVCPYGDMCDFIHEQSKVDLVDCINVAVESTALDSPFLRFIQNQTDKDTDSNCSQSTKLSGFTPDGKGSSVDSEGSELETEANSDRGKRGYATLSQEPSSSSTEQSTPLSRRVAPPQQSAQLPETEVVRLKKGRRSSPSLRTKLVRRLQGLESLNRGEMNSPPRRMKTTERSQYANVEFHASFLGSPSSCAVQYSNPQQYGTPYGTGTVLPDAAATQPLGCPSGSFTNASPICPTTLLTSIPYHGSPCIQGSPVVYYYGSPVPPPSTPVMMPTCGSVNTGPVFVSTPIRAPPLLQNTHTTQFAHSPLHVYPHPQQVQRGVHSPVVRMYTTAPHPNPVVQNVPVPIHGTIVQSVPIQSHQAYPGAPVTLINNPHHMSHVQYVQSPSV